MFIQEFLRLIFYLLYQPFAWTYDWVAGLVSCGKWHSWVCASLPYLTGPRVLELGHGPGHLQLILKQNGVASVGIDLSRQMSAIARRRLRHDGYPADLILGYAQSLAFDSNSFSQVVATFPSEYITEGQTLAEISRVLAPDGKLVVILGGWLTGYSLCQQMTGWLLGGAARHELSHLKRWLEPFQKAGFRAEARIVDLSDSQLLMILATK